MKSKNYILTLTGILFSLMSFSAEYYIKPGDAMTGNDGSSWESAITLSEFYEVYKTGGVFFSGDTFYFLGGTYYPTKIADGDSEQLMLGFNFIGGFDPASTGTVSEIPEYPSATPTIFSGDLNGSGKADVGDAGRLLLIRTNYLDDGGDKTPFVIQGFDFTCAYGLAANYNAGALWARRSIVTVKNCNFYNNESRDYGAGGCLMYGSYCHFVDCSFYNNKAKQSGAALRVATNSNHVAYAIVERCSFYNNEVSGNYGGAVANSSSSDFWLINSTIVDNKALSGGGGFVTNGGKIADNDIRKVYIISSTIAGNECMVNTEEGPALGTQIRFAQPPNVHIANSIVVAKTDNGTYSNSAMALTGTETEGFEFRSDGYNLLGSFTFAVENPTNVPNWLSSDMCGAENTYAEVFGSNTLADNGGCTKTLALKEHIEGAWVEELETMLAEWGAPEGIDWTVDQRGHKRSPDGPSIGAIDMMAKDPTSILKTSKNSIEILSIERGLYSLSSPFNGIIKVFNINGMLVKSITDDTIIDLRDLSSGVYIANIAGTSFKLIK